MSELAQRAPRHVLQVAIALFIVHMSIMGFVISKNPGTPFDEAAHLDYVVKVSNLQLPKVNELYGQEVLGIMACLDAGPAWAGLEECGSAEYTPSLAPFGGQSSATPFLPTYYAVTALPFKVCSISGFADVLNCGRYANSIWLAGATVMGFLLLVLLARPRNLFIPAIASLSVNMMPAVLQQGVTVNTDAAVQFLAFLVPYFSLKISRLSISISSKYLVLLGLFSIAMSVKQTLITVMVISAWLFWVSLRDEGRKVRTASILSGIILTVLATNFVAIKLQPFIRGEGGADNMAQAIQAPMSALPEALLAAIVGGSIPFTQIGYAALSNGILGSLAFIVSLIAWISAARFRAITVLPNSSDSVNGPGIRHYSSYMVLVALIAPFVLGLLTWVSTGVPATQPRYFLGTLSLLMILGFSAMQSNRERLIFSVPLLASLVATSAYVLAI